MGDIERVVRLKPRQYIHVLDNNTGVTTLEVGPQVLTLQDHQQMVLTPQSMVVVPPRHYCVVQHPVVRDEAQQVLHDRHGQVRLREGDFELRFEQEPFALYPGETLAEKVKALTVVAPNAALHLRATRDFSWEGGTRQAGDEWLFRGPGTYLPRIEVELCTTVEAIVLSEKLALQLRATRTFTDVFGRKRRAGDEWLVTFADAEVHLPDVHEKVVGMVSVTTLGDREWCVVRDPVDPDGRCQLGKREVRRGRMSFFLHPGESLEAGVQKVFVLAEREALLLRATESFQDGEERRKPGDRWMLLGPAEYIPPTMVEVVERRSAMPLDKNEGIYVRNSQTGEIRLVRGPTVYLLTAYEELWTKELPPMVEQLLAQDPVLDRFSDGSKTHESTDSKRLRSHAVVYRVPQGAACQVFDFKRGKARVVFGPDLVMLEPDEMFTVLSLSGGRPKRAKMHQSLALLLGPDFMVDVITVETSDHAQLRLQLAYNWHFELSQLPDEQRSRLFSVPDYVGDACNSVASRIRGAVAGVRFEEFHRKQATIIRDAVFGLPQEGRTGELRFPANNLVITNIDIQAVEPVDDQTRASLQRSVQIAIKITTDAQEAAARHDAERLEQEARAKMERQALIDRRESESERRSLLELQAESSAIEATGKAAAEARARAEADRIAGEAVLQLAQQEAEASRIRAASKLAQLQAEDAHSLSQKKELLALELNHARERASIQAKEFSEKVSALGADTVRAIAQAGPELQAKLLQGLGLKSMVITDGHSPLSLFGTAEALISGAVTNASQKLP